MGVMHQSIWTVACGCDGFGHQFIEPNGTGRRSFAVIVGDLLIVVQACSLFLRGVNSGERCYC
jgi:hypothetical protein